MDQDPINCDNELSVKATDNIQLSTSHPNFLILESTQKMYGFHPRKLKRPLLWGDNPIIPQTI